MPRCFMAKKLKYPYEQWKESQVRKSASRSPSPMGGVAGGDPMSDGDEDEEIDLVGGIESSNDNDNRKELGHNHADALNLSGKWCLMLTRMKHGKSSIYILPCIFDILFCSLALLCSDVTMDKIFTKCKKSG